MDASAVLAVQITAVVTVATLVIAVNVAAWCARRRGTVGGAGRAAVHDVERALGAATIMTYEKAAAAAVKIEKASPEGKAEECCAICLSEYAGGGELVRVLPACGHFFHAGCGVDAWLRARQTCPLCRGGIWPLPRPTRPECARMPPRAGRARVGWL